MRDFFTPQYTQGDSAAGVVESRHYPQQDPIRQTNNTISVGQDNDENKMPADESLSRRGFMSASNFAALEAQLGPLKPDAVGPSKRRKTSEGRILRGISGNAVTRHDDTTGAQQVPDEPAISRRKSTLDGSVSKSRRSKSARLPLERVPKGQGTHGLVLNLRQDMFDSAGRIDEKRSLLGMNEPSIDAYDVFGERFDDEALNEVTTRLHELLVMHVPDSEMTQDLGTVVRGAFETYRQQMTEME